MTHKFFKSFLPFVAGSILLAGTGCEKMKDFGDTNVNPLGSTAPITGALLTNAQVGIGALASLIRPGLYVQYFAETQYTDASLYQEPKLDFGSYTTHLEDLQQIIDRNSNPATAGAVLGSGSNANQLATARIMKAYYYWTLTDRWGDIPYFGALKGAANLSPEYDKQEDIYKDLLKELTEAVAQFDNGAKVTGDIMYSGNQAQWKKLANSLRMMISLRMSKVFPAPGAFAATQFAAAANDPNGHIMTNADNFTVRFPGGAAYRHPWYDTYNGRSDYGYSKTLADILSNMSDDRRNAFGGTGTPFPYGITRDLATGSQAPAANAYAKVLSNANRTENAPVVVVNAASVLLAHAEGLERGWITTGSAKASYDAAIQQSFDQWNVTGAASVINGAGNYTSGAGGGSNIGANIFNSVPGQDAITATPLERIFLQRYLAHYPDGLQGWSEWRRSCAPGTPNPATAAAGMPRLRPTTFATNSGVGIPRRYVYSSTEYSTNPGGVGAAVARLTGGDVVQARVWWDK